MQPVQAREQWKVQRAPVQMQVQAPMQPVQGRVQVQVQRARLGRLKALLQMQVQVQKAQRSC